VEQQEKSISPAVVSELMSPGTQRLDLHASFWIAGWQVGPPLPPAKATSP
jgi:hypothetical protein